MARRQEKPQWKTFTGRVSRAAVEATLLLSMLIAGSAGALAEETATGISALQEAESIMILPVVYPAGQTDEDREERFDSLYGKLDDYIYKALLRKMALKGYVLDRPRDWKAPPNWNVEALKGLSPDQLAALSPKRAGHVAFLFIESIDSTNHVVQTSANAIVSAQVIDRISGRVVWKKRAEEAFSEHILQLFSPIGMLLTPDKHAAIEMAFGKLFEDLPERPY